MNKLKMSLRESLSGIDVSPQLEERILQGQFLQKRRTPRIIPIAATVCACAVIVWSISLLPIFSRDNPNATNTTNTTTEPTTPTGPPNSNRPHSQMYRPTVENPPDRTLHSFGTFTGHLDWDEQPDTVTIYPDESSAGPNGYGQVVIEVALGNGRTVTYISKEESCTIKNIARADLFDIDNNDTDDLIVLYEMDYDNPSAFPLRIFTLQVNTILETRFSGYYRFIFFDEEDTFYYFTGLDGSEKRPVPQALQDELYNEDKQLINPLYGYSAINRYELIEQSGIKSIRVYQDVWAGKNRYPLGVGIAQVAFSYSRTSSQKTFQYLEPAFAPSDIQVTFPTAVLGTKPSSGGWAEQYNYEEMVKAYLDAWKNKDLDALNEFFKITDWQYTDKMLQRIDISDYRYEPTKDERVYTVYLDIERSSLKGMPEGKNQKFSLVFDMNVIEEFTLIDPAPIAPVRGVPINRNHDGNYRKNELYYNAFRLLSSGYIDLTSGPIAIDMSKNHYTKHFATNGYNLVDIFPYLFSKEIQDEQPIPVDELLEKFSRICRIQNFDPKKLHGYSSSTNTVMTNHDYSIGFVRMNLTRVRQEGNVYICSFDLFEDPLCTVVTRSLDLTMIDNGDGSYFFDRMDITYTSDISIVTRRPGVDPFP